MPTLVKTNEMLRRLDVYLSSFDWQSLTPSKRSILQAFLRLSTKDGFSSVTMRNLANAVNLKPSSIYSHFPAGKDEILSVALRWNNNIYSMAVKEGLNSCTTPEQFWNALVSTHVNQQIMRPENDLWDLLMTTDRLGEILPQDLRNEMVEWMSFCDFMYEAIATDWGYSDAKQKSRLIRVFIDSTNSWWQWNGSEKNLEECRHYAMRITSAILKS